MPNETKPKVCPIIWTETLAEGKKFIHCDAQCAWYVPEDECCAMLLLARETHKVNNNLKPLNYLGRMRS